MFELSKIILILQKKKTIQWISREHGQETWEDTETT
jgi:hypothetical protein